MRVTGNGQPGATARHHQEHPQHGGERGISVRREAYALSRCAAMTKATHAVSFFAYGTCRNSFGPCAFACGPSTPVMRNCASGKCFPSMAMNGIVPPSPAAAEGLA